MSTLPVRSIVLRCKLAHIVLVVVILLGSMGVEPPTVFAGTDRLSHRTDNASRAQSFSSERYTSTASNASSSTIARDSTPSKPVQAYAQAIKKGRFYGIRAHIETANPALREQVFSSVSINIIGDKSNIETGWYKDTSTGCKPKFYWDASNGNPTVFATPSPAIGSTYAYTIYQSAQGAWIVRIADRNGMKILASELRPLELSYGVQIQAVGETASVTRQNDIGAARIMSLEWMDNGMAWHAWDGWEPGVVHAPYAVVGIPPDGLNNVMVYGNIGNSMPLYAPCPVQPD